MKFLENSFRNTIMQSIKQLGSKPGRTICQALSGSKLFVKVTAKVLTSRERVSIRKEQTKSLLRGLWKVLFLSHSR